MGTADVLADGVINKEEFLGALGTWYVNVGRQATNAMSIAFVALNRTPHGPNFCCLMFSAGLSAMLAYFALDAAFRAGDACGYHLPALLRADGVLWLIFAVVTVLKGRWVQALNLCFPLPRAARLVSHAAGAIVVLEIGAMLALVLIEGVGLFYAYTVADLGKRERRECERTNTTANVEGLPSNLIGFSQQWFALWTFPGTLPMLIYCIYSVIRIRRAFKHES